MSSSTYSLVVGLVIGALVASLIWWGMTDTREEAVTEAAHMRDERNEYIQRAVRCEVELGEYRSWFGNRENARRLRYGKPE